MDPKQSIEKLVDYHVAEDGSEYYLVKWKQTWERAESLRPFNTLIKSFWDYIDERKNCNVTHNNAILPKPLPVLPQSQQPQVQINTNNVRSSPAGKKRTNSTSTKNPSTPKSSKQTNNSQNNNSFQNQPRMMNTSSAGNFSNIGISPFPQNTPPRPQNTFAQNTPPRPQPSLHPMMNQNNQSNQGLSTVVIDSDDDDNPVITEDVKPNIATLDNTSQHQILPPVPQMHTNMAIKNEQMDHPMFQPNMHNPFPPYPHPVGFGMMNNNMAAVTSPSGRGSGIGPSQQLKRQMSLPGDGNGVTNFKMELNNVKQELPSVGMTLNNFPMNQQSQQVPQSPTSALNWQDHMETLESYTNGQRTGVTYKCKLCGASIAQKGNFPRHFKMHQKNS